MSAVGVMRIIRGMKEVTAAVGEEPGVSDWHEMTQQRSDAFADATGDHYWLHTDSQRASESPTGTTIAHGLFTLSLGPMFTDSMITFGGLKLTLNHGYEKVRFPAPLPVDSRRGPARVALRGLMARADNNIWLALAGRDSSSGDAQARPQEVQ